MRLEPLSSVERRFSAVLDLMQALHMAAAGGHSEICALLLIYGSAAANKANRLGATALHMAAKGGDMSFKSLYLPVACFRPMVFL